MKPRSKPLLNLFVLFTLFALTLSALGITSPAAAAQKSADLPSAAEYLNADGTLNLSAGYSGNLDISNYAVTIDPKRGPLFSPAQTLIPNAWNALGATPLNSAVNAIAISGTDVYVGGQFTDAGGDANADYIAKWNGSAWSALGATPLNNYPSTITISGTDVYVGGSFTNAGGDTNADYIAIWNGSAWSALGAGLNSQVFVITISGTDVYAGGAFTNAGGDVNADYIAKWDGSAWSALGTGLNNGVYTIAISGTDVYVGGGFTDAGGDANADRIAKWNGSAWSALGTGVSNGNVYAITISGADVYAGGQFTDAGGDVNADYIAKWNGSAWSALGTSVNFTVRDIAISNTDVYASGDFVWAGGNSNANYIAKWNGNVWSALGGTPLSGLGLTITINGTDLYAGGSFTNAGGDTNADYIAVFAIPPSVLSINRVNASPTNLASIDFTVTFSEDVTGVDIADFKLTNTILTGASITSVSGTDDVYTVTVNTGTGNGTLRLDVLGTATIQGAHAFAGPTYTDGQTYTINKGTAPTVPVLVSPPANALVTNTPTLNWGDSSPVMALAVNPWSYEVTVSDGAFGTYNHTFNTASGLTNSSFGSLPGDWNAFPLSPNTTYYWKVRAYNDANQYSAWSLTRTFRTKLATPVLNLPAGGSILNNKRPTFAWDEVPGATGYTLQVLKAGAVVNTGTIMAPAYTYTPSVNLLPVTVYTWKVKANGLNTGDYSAPFTFTTSANPPKKPILSAPANNVLVDSAVAQTLDWNPVNAVVSPAIPAAASFEVEYVMNASFSGASDTVVVVDDNTIAGTHTAPLTLLPGRTYYWRVRSWSGAGASGNHSAWSLVRMIKVKFVAPTLTSPISGALGAGTRPTFTWSSGLNGLWTSYTLQVANNNLFTMSLRTFTINAPFTTYTIPNSLPALTPGLKYWRVKINGLYFPIFSLEVSPANTFMP